MFVPPTQVYILKKIVKISEIYLHISNICFGVQKIITVGIKNSYSMFGKLINVKKILVNIKKKIDRDCTFL